MLFPLLALSLAINLAPILVGCSSSDPKPKALAKVAAITPSGPLPDLSGGKPFLPNNCVEDAKTAYAILVKAGASPRLLQIDYTGPGSAKSTTNDTQFGHVLLIVKWSGQWLAIDRQGAGTVHQVVLPATVNPGDAKSVATNLFWTCFYAEWTDPQHVHI